MSLSRLRKGALGLWMAWTLGGVATLYVVYCLTLFTIQRSIMYKPRKAKSPLPAQPIWLDIPGARVEARWSPAPDSQALVGIFLHGNAETIDDWPVAIEPWNRHGVSVLRVEFPSYGYSTGEGATEENIRQASEKAYDWLIQQGIPKERIFAAGRSLGGGIACDLSTTRPLAGLFLQSTFRSMRDRGVKTYHVPGFLVRDAFENTNALESFSNTVLLMQGTEDKRIPYADLAVLAHAAPQAHVTTFAGYHHSDIPGKDSAMYWDSVGQFLSDIRHKGGRRSL